jgi:secreted Zn-dependent insulinase-like peptidase
MHPRSPLLLLLCLITVNITVTANAASIEKSPNDSRDYRQLVLENGLKVTLIHDSETDMAAAAMDVAVGAGSDPRDRPGLAHFLEHMLFLGTAKYPQPDAYASFIQQHGGSQNAYTTFADTNYFFEIEASHLAQGLDRFAQFFIAPLFSESLVQREKNAVHSEFTGKRLEENLRYWSVRREMVNPAHPYSGFTTGNLETLADRPGSDIRDELIDFYHTHYSSNIMSLAIYGSDSLDQMEQWARASFSAIENRAAEKQRFDTPLFTRDQLAKRIDIVPLTDQRFMVLSFPVPKAAHHRFSRPRSYVGNVLGHEGPGSLLSALKRRGWVTSLSAGSGTETRNAATFEISIGLTKSGVEHVDEIVGTVFTAVNRLKESGLPRWLYDEKQQIDDLAFRYQEKSSPAGTVRSLSVRAQDWPAPNLLSGPYRRSHFDTEGVRAVITSLTPRNMQMIVVAPGLETDRTTQWYDAPFRVTTIADNTLAQWQNAGIDPHIIMPAPNPFLPDNLTLLADGQGDPLKLIDTPKLQVWHRTDSSYGVPKANFRANLHLPTTGLTLQNKVLTEIYARLVNEQLNEYAYAASLAGLRAGVRTTGRGLGITLSGYADGQQQMLQRVVREMSEFVPDPSLFAEIRRELQENIHNEARAAPYKRTAARTYQLLYTPYFTEKERLGALEVVTPEALTEFHATLFARARLVVLSHGNLTGRKTLSMVETITSQLLANSQAARADSLEMIELPAGSAYADEITLDHSDASISLYLQSQTRDRATRARYAVLRQILSQPLYNELRTRQQLGYFVFTYSIDLIQVPSVVIGLQSPVAGPTALYRAVETFLTSFETELMAMSNDEFQRNIESVIAQVEEKDKQLRHQTNRYWGAIVREDYQFDASSLFAVALQKVTQQHIIDLYRQLFIEKENGRLLVFNEGQSTETRNNDSLPDLQIIEGLNSFKRGKQRLLPLSRLSGIE